MDEDLEQLVVELVAALTPEQYVRFGPALQEFGLSLAETREAYRESERVREVLESAREDLARAEERSQNALRLIREAE